MAFSNNDYVAVNDQSGKPAFELLYYPRTNWLLEEHVEHDVEHPLRDDARLSRRPVVARGMMGGG